MVAATFSASEPASQPQSFRKGRNPLATRVETRNGIPVLPGAFPLIGHLPAVVVDELALMRDAVRAMGPVFYFSRGYQDFNVAYAGRDAFSLFKNRLVDSSYMRQGRIGELFGAGIVAQDGAVHRHLRSAMSGPFLPKGLAETGVGPLVGEVVERWVRGFVGRRRVRVLAETRELALETMFRLVGVDPSELSAWRERYEKLMLLAIALPADIPGSPGWFGKRARDWLDVRIQAIIDRVRASDEDHGFLSAILSSRDDEGHGLTDRELRDNVRVILLAGHETSATTMAWIVAHLASDRGAWQRLREEALAAEGVPRSPKDLRSFPYAEGVFREALRLHPPVSSDARRTIEDLDLEGFIVPKGTLVSIPIGLLSRDPDLYPDPDAFRPERWIGRAAGISPTEMVQFGGGPHFCLGYHLAWMEIVQFAVALARHLPARGPRLEGAFPVARYLPLQHPNARFEARFDG